MKKIEAKVVGYIVQFLPRKEIVRDGATIILHPKIGKWLNVALNGDRDTWRSLSVGRVKWEGEGEPGPEVEDAIDAELRKRYPRSEKVIVREYTDPDGRRRQVIE